MHEYAFCLASCGSIDTACTGAQNPWRAPGHAPIYDPWCAASLPSPRLGPAHAACHRSPLRRLARLLCLRSGRASGGPHETGGKGEFTNTTFAKIGDLGSRVLPKYDTGTVWKAGSTVETMTSYRAIHGGGYQFRLCPLESNLTEACFHQTPMPFVGNSRLMISDGSMIELDSVDVTNGTLPVGGTWRMLGIPDKRGAASRLGPKPYKTWAFEPPCHEPGYPDHPDGNNQGNCSGDWTHNITMYDYLRVPEHLVPGEYVLGFR